MDSPASDWSFEAILTSPLLWGVICLLTIALTLSGKLDMTAAKWVLLAEWIMATFSFYRFAPILRQPLIPRVLLVVILSAAFGFGAYHLSVWMSHRPSPVPESSGGLQTVHELFKDDFPNLLKVDSEPEFNDGPKKTKIQFRLYLDFDAKSKFISFYIPPSPQTFDVCKAMPDLFRGLLDEADKVSISGQVPGNSAMDHSKDLVFTGKFFAYYEENLTLEQLGQLEGLYKSKGFSIQFRGMNYAVTRMLQSRAK
jgi:hypothetical protein